MLDVVGQQFLMLLLVMEAEHDPLRHFLWRIGGQQALNPFLHVLAVLQDGFHRRPGEGSAQFLFRLVGYGVVVAIEQPAKVGMKLAVAGKKFPQQKCLEKPCGVRQVPLGRARLGAGLHHHVFGRQGKTKVFGLAPYA